MIDVKRAFPSDAKVIVSTRQTAWDATYRGIYPDEVIDNFDWDWHLEAEIRRLQNPDFLCWIVYDDNNPVGYVSCGTVRRGLWKDFSFRLHSLYLLPQYQNLGLGRRLFFMVEDVCKEKGFFKMYLDCHPRNKNALGFYGHMGGIISAIDAGHDNPQEDTCTIEFLLT